ncbi:sensor histidine kinase [Fibrella forsythiae]|uniref:histidine kinase n=1 Tax=Fibrella forsythiae TaxID=2817061 RepID=A0ABS3JTX0_9BACT|nr:ATP-binding protein [Fibrella forsythiae]MBO0952846.1 hypothetical protein [Fibrella forsythiae]
MVRLGASVFFTRWARFFFDAAGMPLKIEGTAQDITAQQELQLVLEQQVQERTEELDAANEELAASNEELLASYEEMASANEQLNEANHLLNLSNENLRQFAYIASHDLQEPLRKIQTFGALFQAQYGPQLGEGINYIQRMQAAATRMSSLIQDLLDFSRLATQPDAEQLTDLNEVVDVVLTDLEMLTSESEASVKVKPLPTVRGDGRQLGQLFQNLLSNAIKFRRPNVTAMIQIQAIEISQFDLPIEVRPPRQARSYYRIDVVDNGIGFEPQYAQRIFQVFQRLHGKEQYSGRGIGLAICEKAVTNCGGPITATSSPGEGAIFSVYLPKEKTYLS